MFAKALRLFKDLKKTAFFSHDDRRMLRLLSQKHSCSAGKLKVLIQARPEHNFIVRILLLLKAWRQGEQGYDIDWAWVLIPFRRNQSLKTYLINEVLKEPLRRRKWKFFYQAIGGQFRLSPNELKLSPDDFRHAREICQRFKKPTDLADWKDEDGQLWGDLVYDTYLRFARRPTIDLNDEFLVEMMAWTLRLIRAYNLLFESRKYESFITLYSAYIHHGIPVRIALARDIPVYVLGAPNQLVGQPKPGYHFHRRNFHRYHQWANELNEDDRKEALKIGHMGLQRRFAGEKDSATSYMRDSAYRANPNYNIHKILGPKNRTTVLLMGHDFFDSPHIYGDMIYPDFYIWMDETLKTLSETDFEVLVKPHPNAIEGNEKIYSEFEQRFPKAKFLPSQTSNLELVERGIDLVLTVYGTIAHELAYLGVRVLCAGDNPHSTFSFCKTTVNEQEYHSLIRNPEALPLPQAGSDEIALFYFVHNYRNSKENPRAYSNDMQAEDAVHWLNPDGDDFASKIEIWRESIDSVSSI